MKKLLSLLILVTSVLHLQSQDELHCATDRIMNAYYEKHPELKLKKKQEDEGLSQRIHNNAQVNTASFTIPIVFHILHTGGPENISDAQVRDGLRILNRDYAKQNPDTTDIIPVFKQLADSMQIQFAFATIDPNGNCTNGIVHYYDTDTDWNDSSPTLYSHTWDPTKYLNVYIVRGITLGSGFNAAGYTYFPGTFGPGDPMDAIVVLNNYFGSIGTSSDFTSRVLTHEIGHWLSLYHVFGGTNGAGVDCFNDDFISDTPQTAGFLYCPDSNDPSSYQLCTPGVDENFQNYMDYSYCCRMFTQEQGAAMRTCLMNSTSGRDNISSATNLAATGVTNPMTLCAPIADFMYSRAEVCVGTPVVFSDISQNGTPTSYTWTMTGATPAASNAASPSVVYNTPGLYTVTYVSANSAGTSAPVTKTSIITVTNATALYQNSYTEGFETDVFAGTEWNEYSSSGGSHWVMTYDAAYTGSASALVPWATNSKNMHTVMESPSVDLSTFSNPVLTYAYASQEVNAYHVNEFKVYITTDCGVSWTRIDSISAMDMATGGIGPAPYVPFDISEWVQRYVNLSAYSSAPFVYFKFLYVRDIVTGGANNFYLDDININSLIGLAEEKEAGTLRVFPNPTNGEVRLALDGKTEAVYITDVVGKLIEKNEGTLHATEVRMLGNKKPEAGIYFVHAVREGKETVRKIIVN